MNEITINGEKYIKKSEIKEMSKLNEEGFEYVVIRTDSSGVHAGYLKSRNGKVVELINSRRIWKWYGANELCGLATIGILNIEDSCISPVQYKIILTEAIEVLSTTEKAKNIIEGAVEWIAK